MGLKHVGFNSKNDSGVGDLASGPLLEVFGDAIYHERTACLHYLAYAHNTCIDLPTL